MSENKKGIKKSKDSFMTELSFLFSQDRSDQEGLYFPRRRVRIDDPSKARLLNRIENQDFKGTSEQEINECWEEMARQIKTFKRKYRKLEVTLQQKDINYQVDPLSAYESTQKVIAKS